MPSLKEQILALAKKRRAKVGIGLIDPRPPIVESLKKASTYADVMVIGAEVPGFKSIIVPADKLEERQAEMIVKGEVEGLVRGQSDTYRFEDALAKIGGYDRSKILIVSLWEDAFGRSFLAAPTSHGEGWTKKHKVQLVDAMVEMAKDFSVQPKLGFLTWVRPGSVGRNFFLDQTWEQAEDLVAHYTREGYSAKNYNIEIEKALTDGVNVVVFTCGPSGNMFFRTMMYVAGIYPLAAPHVGIPLNICENSRNQDSFFNEIVFCAAMANKRV